MTSGRPTVRMSAPAAVCLTWNSETFGSVPSTWRKVMEGQRWLAALRSRLSPPCKACRGQEELPIPDIDSPHAAGAARTEHLIVVWCVGIPFLLCQNAFRALPAECTVGDDVVRRPVGGRGRGSARVRSPKASAAVDLDTGQYARAASPDVRCDPPSPPGPHEGAPCARVRRSSRLDHHISGGQAGA
jgi:hypothetical protein